MPALPLQTVRLKRTTAVEQLNRHRPIRNSLGGNVEIAPSHRELEHSPTTLLSLGKSPHHLSPRRCSLLLDVTFPVRLMPPQSTCAQHSVTGDPSFPRSAAPHDPAKQLW